MNASPPIAQRAISLAIAATSLFYTTTTGALAYATNSSNSGPTTTTKSYIAKFGQQTIYGIPLNENNANIAMLSCQAQLIKRTLSDNKKYSTLTYRFDFSSLNRTGIRFKEARIFYYTVRSYQNKDGQISGFTEAPIYSIKPREYREVQFDDNLSDVPVSSMYCGIARGETARGIHVQNYNNVPHFIGD